jgi:hypothetical protein
VEVEQLPRESLRRRRLLGSVKSQARSAIHLLVKSYDVSIYSIPGLARDLELRHRLEAILHSDKDFVGAEADLYSDPSTGRLSIALGSSGASYNEAVRWAVDLIEEKIGAPFPIDFQATHLEQDEP